MTRSSQPKVACILGTRPEAIKMAPVITALRECEAGVITKVCVTGQHREMLQQVLDAFDITPDADLQLMRANQTLAGLTSRAVEAIDTYLAQERPHLVLIQGDTTTAFCAALAAFYHRVPVGHVEAGLRTRNLLSPWPEEANRTLISHLSALNFCPTEASRQNLLREGIEDCRITVTGNTVVDALQHTVGLSTRVPVAIPGLDREEMESWGNSPLILITGHRRESFGPGFESICAAIKELACRFPHVHFVYPVHLNPNVRGPVYRILGPSAGNVRNIHLVEPLAYLPFVALMHRATFILTDSGGIQEEAPSLGKAVLVMRDTTERPEGVEAGCTKLIGTDKQRIVDEVSKLLMEPATLEAMSRVANPYGDGQAAPRIRDTCIRYLGLA